MNTVEDVTKDDELSRDDLKSLSKSEVPSLSMEGMMSAMVKRMKKDTALLTRHNCKDIELDEHIALTREHDLALDEETTRHDGGSPADKEAAIELLLNESMAQFLSEAKYSREDLWMNLKMLAYYRCEVSYKQLSFRDTGTELDVAHNFAVHAMRKIDQGKYHGKRQDRSDAEFSHWINKVFRRFADTELGKLTKSKKMFCPLSESSSNDDEDQVESSHSDKEAGRLWSTDQRLQSYITDALKGISETDKIYAGHLKSGLNQREAAEKMGESVVTSRRREARIRAALQCLQGCADKDNLLPWSDECIRDIQGCAAEDAAFEPLLGAKEAAKLLCVHEKTVQAMARSGEIPCLRFGKYWRFRASVLDEWIKDRLTSDHQSRCAS